jgi:hypothetical protein
MELQLQSIRKTARKGSKSVKQGIAALVYSGTPTHMSQENIRKTEKMQNRKENSMTTLTTGWATRRKARGGWTSATTQPDCAIVLHTSATGRSSDLANWNTEFSYALSFTTFTLMQGIHEICETLVFRSTHAYFSELTVFLHINPDEGDRKCT